MLNVALSPWPRYSEEEIAAVGAILESGRVNQWTGSQVNAFNTDFAAWCGVDHAIGLANGTLALEAALRAIDLRPGDEIIVTPRTFIASVSCVLSLGGMPVFCDVDRDSGNVTPAAIEACLSPRTKAIIPVHLGGWPCDMTAIMDIAAEKGIWVIEDCAQAHGAKHRGRPVGGWGHIAAWSFCQDKIMSTGGEGGAITTNLHAFWRTIWAFKDHGKNYAKVHAKDGATGFRWLHDSVGTNWRMLEIQAAIGRLQLVKMDEWSERRRANALILHDAVREAGDVVRAPQTDAADQHAYYRFYCYVQPEALAAGWSRDRIIDEALKLGLPLFQGACPEVYLEKAFDRAPGRPDKRLPVASELGETSLMALVHPTLTGQEIERCGQIFADVLRRARR